MDYRLSHTAPEKGMAYNKSFSDLPYRRLIWLWEQQVLSTILKEYFQQKPENYLDFATGTGRIIGFFENQVTNAIGLDISASMLAVARQNVKKAKFYQGDITQEDFFSETRFDLITAFRFFLNAQWSLKNEVILKLGECLQNNGYLVFNIHMNRDCLLAKMIRVYCKVRRIPCTTNFMSTSEVESLVKLAGLKIIKTYHYGVIPILKEDAALPYQWVDKVEKFFSKYSSFGKVSRFVIFVCQKA